jgi:hypothetical protein
LFEVPFDGASSNTHGANHRYWGYYADGYFDRRAIGTADNNGTDYPNTVVSVSTKDAAYIGILYTNPASGASLFAPAGGYRLDSDGSLYYSGCYGYYWSSSSYNQPYGWTLLFPSSYAGQYYAHRSSGFAVRCVKAE